MAKQCNSFQQHTAAVKTEAPVAPLRPGTLGSRGTLSNLAHLGSPGALWMEAKRLFAEGFSRARRLRPICTGDVSLAGRARPEDPEIAYFSQ
jgi:hypothetical protein